MFIFLSKVIPPFLTPPGVNLVLFLGAWLLKRRLPKLATTLFVVSFTLLALASSGIGASALIEPLEKPYPLINAAQLPNADAIVVLGGYLRHGSSEQRAELSHIADRLWFGVELYRSGKAPIVLLAGGNVPFVSGAAEPESIAAARVIEAMDVPASAVRTEYKSRNTRENAVLTADLLLPKGLKRVLLVTSALHMRRAAALFQRAGLEVIPAPCDHMTGWEQPDLLFRLLPEAGNLQNTQTGLHEWIGIVVYKIRGWI